MRPVFLDLYAVSKDLQESLQKGFECKVQLGLCER